MTVRTCRAVVLIGLSLLLSCKIAWAQQGYILELSDGKLVDAKTTDGITSAAGADRNRSAIGSSGAIYFRSCDEARRSGYSSMYRGFPGYREGLDADNDGIACEPYRGRR